MMTQKDYQALCWGWGVSVIARSVNLRQTHCSRIVSGPTFILKVHPSTHPPTHPPTIHPPFSGWHKSDLEGIQELHSSHFEKWNFTLTVNSFKLNRENVTLWAPLIGGIPLPGGSLSDGHHPFLCGVPSMRVCWPGPDLEVIRTLKHPPSSTHANATSSSSFELARLFCHSIFRQCKARWPMKNAILFKLQKLWIVLYFPIYSSLSIPRPVFRSLVIKQKE